MPVAAVPDPPTEEPTPSLLGLFELLSSQLQGELVERDREIHGAQVALLAGEHCFYLGPPGTAKSALVDRLTMRIAGVRLFKILMRRLTMPDEIFGPIDVPALQNSRWTRAAEGFLPTAQIAWLDEALALTTPIPTPSGWTTIGDIAVGDEVFGSDGLPTKVTALSPIATNHPCYEMTFRDGETLVADGGHKWLCRPATNGPLKMRVMTTSEMVEATLVRRSRRRTGQYQIPMPAAMEQPERALPIDPYVLGLWLGNGNNFTGELYIRDEFVDETLRLVQKAYPTAYVGRQLNGIKAISLAGSGVRTCLSALNLIQNKHMPPAYLRGSIAQRLALLQGLMDTDGNLSKTRGEAYGTCVFSNTNESVVDGVAEIVRSLGIIANKVRTKDERVGANGPHQPCWKVTFRGEPSLPPFLARPSVVKPRHWQRQHLIQKITPVPSVPVRCITVAAEDHLFVAGRNMVLTHNCFKASSAILNGLLDVLNERTWRDDGRIKQVPLSTMFCASNEEPQEEGLVALYDRIMLRYVVRPVQDMANFVTMLSMGTPGVPQPVMSWAEVEAAKAAVAALPIPVNVYDKIAELRGVLKENGIEPTERRFVRSLGILKAEAWLDGATSVAPAHMSILSHVLWERPDQQADVEKLVLELANPQERKALSLLADIEGINGLLEAALKKKLSEDDAHARGMEIFHKVKSSFKELNQIEAESGGGRRLAELVSRCRVRLFGICKTMITEVFGMPESAIPQFLGTDMPVEEKGK